MRGKTKIGMSAFLLSMLVVSFFATLVVPTVSASSTAELRGPSVVNPLLAPGATFGVDILTANAKNVWSVEFTLEFDTSLITPIGYFFTTGGETRFVNVFAADLNDAGGYVHLGATRPAFGGKGVDSLGISDGVTTHYTLSNGVIEQGSEQGFYKVTKEFLGQAQAVVNVGGVWRDPGPWTGGGGDGKVDRMPIIPSPYPGVEMVYRGTARYIYSGDPSQPYWITDYTDGSVKSSQVPPYNTRWPANGSKMYMDYATLQGVPAIASMDYAHSAGVGSVDFATAPTAGESVYLQYRYRSGIQTDVTLLVASIIFKVDSRGTCPLHFASSTLLDQHIPANTITHNDYDGVFDNRLQGTMYAPTIVDTTLVNEGDYFNVYVSVGPWMDKNIEKLWGFQFIMDYDPNIIIAVDFDTLGIFMPGPCDINIPGLAAITGNSYYGDPDGLSTSVPVEVVRIGFVVLAKGVTLLTLRDTSMVDVDGATMVHETVSGSFANTVNISVSLNTIFVEKRKWSVSKDGGVFTLTAQVTNTGDGITMTRAVFEIYEGGIMVGDLTTAEVEIYPGTTIRLEAKLAVTAPTNPISYDVVGTCEYINYMGTWVKGHKGQPSGARISMVKAFTLYP